MIDTDAMATGFHAELPPWVWPFLDDYEAPLASSSDRMELVHALADRNWVAGNGGPFAAVVADSGDRRDRQRRSERRAVQRAVVRARRGDRDQPGAGRGRRLGSGHPARPGLELVVNWRPCAMCLGAFLWSGVQRLVVAGDGPELEELTGFDEGPVVTDWVAQLARRGITVEPDVQRDGRDRHVHCLRPGPGAGLQRPALTSSGIGQVTGPRAQLRVAMSMTNR